MVTSADINVSSTFSNTYTRTSPPLCQCLKTYHCCPVSPRRIEFATHYRSFADNWHRIRFLGRLDSQHLCHNRSRSEENGAMRQCRIKRDRSCIEKQFGIFQFWNDSFEKSAELPQLGMVSESTGSSFFLKHQKYFNSDKQSQLIWNTLMSYG